MKLENTLDRRLLLRAQCALQENIPLNLGNLSAHLVLPVTTLPSMEVRLAVYVQLGTIPAQLLLLARLVQAVNMPIPLEQHLANPAQLAIFRHQLVPHLVKFVVMARWQRPEAYRLVPRVQLAKCL